MIEVRAVSYHYPDGDGPESSERGGHAALREVSAQVLPGEIVGVVGPNGSGKSTLGRLMKGLLLPTSGEVLVDGLDTRTQALETRRLVGLVFQNPNSQIVNAVVEQEVAFGPENLGLPTSEIRARVDEALGEVGLLGRATADIHTLSMADKQRVAIASVMAMHPGYLILDEATTWLEPSARWPILEEVLRWSREREAGLVMITHRMDEAQLCQRLYGLLDGRLEITGTPDEVLGNAEARGRLALDVPESVALAAELRAAGVPIMPGAGVDRLAESLCQS
jgi:energy-coupling factor transport system ATP-binding protein